VDSYTQQRTSPAVSYSQIKSAMDLIMISLLAYTN